jgi:hypothetical protein
MICDSCGEVFDPVVQPVVCPARCHEQGWAGSSTFGKIALPKYGHFLVPVSIS